MTPLHWAAYYEHMETITLLLERGADIEAKNKVSYADREIHLIPYIHTPALPSEYST